MGMDSLYKLEEMCCRELDKLTQRGDFSSSTLQQAAMLADTIKDIKTVEAMDDGESNSSYGDYAGRRGHYVRAHYSRDNSSRGRYARDDEKEEMMKKLERMANDAEDSSERSAYRSAMENLRNA